jgi:hypothetical protein
MIEDFKQKLKESGKSLSWFHRKYLRKQLNFTYFQQQIHTGEIQSNVLDAIESYLGGK